ncbi:penicillin-binding protein [Microbacteriaceae bacterium]|nr:penicillin-binding protein [Candidatus Saccharibacteria bacterium]
MVKKQPARLGRYANLAGIKPAPKKRKTSRGGRFAWFWALSRNRKIAVIATPIILFLILTPLITYAMLANDISDKERLMNRNNTGIVLNDINGKPVYSIGKAEHRTLVTIKDMSPDLKDALVASEDKDFYKHGGFNLGSIVRSLWTNIVMRSASAYGGSTLTQQLAKNTLLSDDKSFLRKYQELAVSIAIEQNYSKDEILEMYLNSVYYGENSFGIEDAAKTYFGKEPKDLDLAESSMLIGVLPAPSAYSPISGSAEYAKQRQKTVLTRMVTNGYIKEEEKTAALAEELTYAKTADTPDSIAPHFVEMVIAELSKKYGYEKVIRSGFQVKTTLDTTAQDALNQSVANAMPHINANGGSNASGVVIDPKTGGILALVGSADYMNDKFGKVNMVTTARQPGSSFKPIYYSYALADGVITPATILKDEKTDFGGGYTPNNADKRFRGNVSVRQALDWSLNIPALKVMQDYTIDKSVVAANKLGLDLDTKADYNLTLALGSSEVPLMKMTNAYAAFANQGAQNQTFLIQEVRDKYDKKIQSHVTVSAKQVISKEGAYLVSNILSDNTTRSAVFGSSLTVAGHTAAVKTGTTNDNRDAWTIGYNPEYTVGVWVGNNDNTAMVSGGSDMAGPIWRSTMQKLLLNKTNTQFTVPSGIVQRATCVSNGGLATESGNGTYNEYFMAGALPSETCEPTPTVISVCDLDTKKVITIDEKKYNSATQSKNLDDCKTKQIQVCDIAKKQVVMIDEDKYDATKYSKDTTNCTTGTGTGAGTGTGSTTPTPPPSP